LIGQGKTEEAIVEYRKAIAEYGKAIEVDPRDVGAHGGLGDALIAQQKTDEAIAEYREAIDLDSRQCPERSEQDR
jgi:tetratricopeptide (TPR) repeat protein